MIRDVTPLVITWTVTPAIVITCALVVLAYYADVRRARKQERANQAIRDEFAANVLAGRITRERATELGVRVMDDGSVRTLRQ